jgi:hypothetical protein
VYGWFSDCAVYLDHEEEPAEERNPLSSLHCFITGNIIDLGCPPDLWSTDKNYFRIPLLWQSIVTVSVNYLKTTMLHVGPDYLV